jgi:hypothetical protein
VLETSVMLTMKVLLALILYYDFILYYENALPLTLLFAKNGCLVNGFEEQRNGW